MGRTIKNYHSHSGGRPLDAGRAGRDADRDRLNPIPATGVTAARAISARAGLLDDSASQFTDGPRIFLETEIGEVAALFQYFSFNHEGEIANVL